MLSSTYQTPGRRAFGHLGVMPDDQAASKWGKFDAAGLQIAAGVDTVFMERARPPCFVKATKKVKGEKHGTAHLFFVRAFVHEEGVEDIVVSIGYWCVDHPWLKEYYGKLLGARKVKEAAKNFPGAQFLCPWKDAVPLRDIEVCVCIEPYGLPPAVSRVADDSHAYPLAAVLQPEGWYLQVKPLVGEWGMAELLARLPALPAFPALDIAPPSGLVPGAADYADAYTIGDRTVDIGRQRGRPLHGFFYAPGLMGELVRRPDAGATHLQVRPLLKVDDPAIAPLLGQQPADERAWGRSPASEVVLSEHEIAVPLAAVPLPVETFSVVPSAMYHTFRVSGVDVRQAELRLDAAGQLVALQEPITPAAAVRELSLHAARCQVSATHVAQGICSEIYRQVTPEPAAQPKGLVDSRTEIRAFDYDKLVVLMKVTTPPTAAARAAYPSSTAHHALPAHCLRRQQACRSRGRATATSPSSTTSRTSTRSCASSRCRARGGR